MMALLLDEGYIVAVPSVTLNVLYIQALFLMDLAY